MGPVTGRRGKGTARPQRGIVQTLSSENVHPKELGECEAWRRRQCGRGDNAWWAGCCHGSVGQCWSQSWMRPGGAHWYDQINSLQLLSIYSVPGKDPSTSLGLTLPGNGNQFFLIPNLQMRELSPIEAKRLAEDHTAAEDSNKP